MEPTPAPQAPPFCPNHECAYHRDATGWRYKRAGFHDRASAPLRVQRYRCRHCRRYFSDQTFLTTYWLRRPDLLPEVFHALVGCSCFRQMARALQVSPQTIARHCARLGRHCQLFHERLRPKGPVTEALVLDSFQSFEHSQYTPTLFHLLGGKQSHYFHGFTVTELRRSGRMSARQKRYRAKLEAKFGKPDPRSTEREVAELLRIVLPQAQALELWSDEHQDYPRALRRNPQLKVQHCTISSRAARTSRNPLFAINLMDLLIRHSGSNHKRETIAFSKRRQSAAGRLWVTIVWRNYLKWFSERNHGQTPAMRAGVTQRRFTTKEVLAARLFPTRIQIPTRWEDHYWGRIPTRRYKRCRQHECRLAT